MTEIQHTEQILSINPDKDVENNVHETDDDKLVESLLIELDGRAEQDQIRQAIMEVREKYKNATIETFIPILIRRGVLAKLGWIVISCLLFARGVRS